MHGHMNVKFIIVMLKAERLIIDYLDDAQLFLLPQLVCLNY